MLASHHYDGELHWLSFGWHLVSFAPNQRVRVFWLVYLDGTLRGGDRSGICERVLPHGGVVVVVGWGNAFVFEVLRYDNHACCQGQIGGE